MEIKIEESDIKSAEYKMESRFLKTDILELAIETKMVDILNARSYAFLRNAGYKPDKIEVRGRGKTGNAYSFIIGIGPYKPFVRIIVNTKESPFSMDIDKEYHGGPIGF